MNSEEIAKIANVSRSTVSRVVNNYKNVPKETREKIQKIIDEYGYAPNASARTLAGKANNIIGLFIADFNSEESNGKWIGANSPYNMELIQKVIVSCKRRGYLTLVYTIDNPEECTKMQQYFTNRMIYGGIFVGFPYHTKELIRLSENGNNIVLIDQLKQEEDVNQCLKLVNSDNIQGGYLATKYLIEKGHRKIAHIAGDGRLSSIERQMGFENAMKKSNISINPNFIAQGKYREDIAYEVTKNMLSKEVPTAIFVANDIMAYGVMRAIREKNLIVAQDISLIGYDNLDGAEWMDLKLTSISIDLGTLAERSVAALFRNESYIYESCSPSLIEKSSVSKI